MAVATVALCRGSTARASVKSGCSGFSLQPRCTALQRKNPVAFQATHCRPEPPWRLANRSMAAVWAVPQCRPEPRLRLDTSELSALFLTAQRGAQGISPLLLGAFDSLLKHYAGEIDV